MTSQQIQDLAQQLLGKAVHALDPEEHNVLTNIQSQMPISRDAADVADERSTYGERLADKVAAVGGSWGFIIAFFFVLVGWMMLNTDVLAHWQRAFDPYPYIFLNLMLSMLAAVQAPIILMSQNRQATKDRVAASLDFEVNLRAELEILHLHDKLDAMRDEQIVKVLARQEETLELLRAQVAALAAKG